MSFSSVCSRIRSKTTATRIRWIVYVLLITGIFFINTSHESYPDEFDNILGGRYILEGKLPYTHFFTHHGPVPYYLAAFVNLFSGQSFVRFRIIYSFILLGITFLGYRLLKKRLGEKVKFYPFYIFTLAIAITYFWGNMLLADNIAGFLLTPVYLLILLSLLYRKAFTLYEIVVISIFSFLSLFSSLTYTYLITVLYALSLFLFLQLTKQRSKRKVIIALLVILLPYLLYGSFLLVLGGMDDYVDQNILFNAKYYIYNYPRPERSGKINPVRFAVIIAYDFYNNFVGLLANAKDFNFTFPFNVALAVANTVLLLVFLISGRYTIAVFLLLILIYSNARSNPLTSGERDYQSAVYIMTSMANVFVLLSLLGQLLNKKIETAKKIIYGFFLIIAGLYSFFAFLFIFSKFKDKVYDKYMGKAPLIYDRPQLAPIINKIISKDDYMWIGPFEFEELYYAKGKLPSKYHILIPGMGRSKTMVREMIADFRANKPKVIMFDRRFFILGESPEMFAPEFIKFLNEEYVTFFKYSDGDRRYVSVIPITARVDIETKLYIDKDKIREIVDKMLEENLIRVEKVSFK